MSGVSAALSGGGASRPIPQVAAEAVAYAETSVPDAIKRLKPAKVVLTKMAEGYANKALAKIAAKL